MKVKSLTELNVSSHNVESHIVLKLRSVEIEKRLFFKPKVTPIRSKNCPPALKNFKESNASRYSVKSSAVLKLGVEFETREFFKAKMTPSYNYSLQPKRIEYMV